MLPVDFPGSNIVLVDPKVPGKTLMLQDVPAFSGLDKWGMPCFITAWQPSKEDIDAILQGKAIFVKMLGDNPVPVALYTADENNKINYIE